MFEECGLTTRAAKTRASRYSRHLSSYSRGSSYLKALPILTSEPALFPVEGEATKPKQGSSRLTRNVVAHVVIVRLGVEGAVTNVIGELYIKTLFLCLGFFHRLYLIQIGFQLQQSASRYRCDIWSCLSVIAINQHSVK